VNVFALEYTGYGASTGEPSVANTIADIDAGYDYLTETMRIPASDIVLYGQVINVYNALSLSRQCTLMAAYNDVMSMILTPFISLLVCWIWSSLRPGSEEGD